ncbi:endolytic transglycosylase MltG [Mesorhizobium sp. YM1C-6-2]|uniref:endolytic transglycosylase MltG n=1 Tax=Mesorhizobium sp. YM1C-6-2 TaxID=1827501 RepID=UPI000EF1D58E|nr:endolytic transglycosylase MltG [Mesorhizobium sp. YM1C-6-2]RLP25526.1 endolytic transglycosylase MltG [Mesorhizobium sp. YM1C-6-2]
MSSEPASNGEFGRRSLPPQPIVPKTASEALRPELGTPPPKRSRASRSQIVVFMNFIVTGAMLAVIVVGLALYIGKREFDGPGPSTTTTNFMVRPNTGVAEIAEQLERRGLISDSRIFRLGVRAYDRDSGLKAGEYEIKAGASMRDIMELLESGKSVLASLTIPEGLTVEQAFQRIAEHEALTGDMPAEMPPEGSLIADTQRFTRGATRQQIIDKMLADQKRLVETIWNRRVSGLPLADINEFVTLASIVEKETAVSDERSRVAAVFINRLNKGMRLQSDPTILYGLFGGKGRPADRPIYQSDIDKPTPYNTYTINGLPPGPIANPGRESLEAVANPSKTKDLYFVADGTGGHVFATTLEEHNENVARWRAIQRKQREEAAKAAQNEATPASTAQ